LIDQENTIAILTAQVCEL
jgi:hypothetical protein